jgi:branched-chain amino acid transport system substrate-binding protein
MVGSPIAGAQILVGVPAPFSGPVAWTGAEIDQGVKRAMADLNAAGGVLGQEVRVIEVDDFCDPEQAVAAAGKLLAEGVDFVLGHVCSGAAIPASKIYADAGVLMMTTIATNPVLTEQGFSNVFRICGRDDDQGGMAGAHLADRWPEGNIAILHDGAAYGQGLAEEARKALSARGVTPAVFEQIDTQSFDYTEVIDRIQAADAGVLYYAGYPREAALLIQQLRERGDDLQLVAGDGVPSEEFRVIAGQAGEGMLFTDFLDARILPEAADVLAAYRADGQEPNSRTLLTYAGMQAWAQAVEQAGSTDVEAVSQVLHAGEFDTIFGRIGFDEKGDVTGYEPFSWYVWKAEGSAPANLSN